jgi:predicted peptidase
MHTLKTHATEAANESGGEGGATMWKEVTADSNNVFRTRRFGGGGYLYFNYNSPKQETVLLNIRGNSAVYVNGVLHTGDPYGAGWLYIPVVLQKGSNDLFVRTYFQTVVSIVYPAKKIAISTADSTMPHIVLNKQNGMLKGAVVIINADTKELKNYQVKAVVSGKTTRSDIASIPPLTTRKVIFDFDAGSISQTGKYDCSLSLVSNNKVVDEKNIMLEAVDSNSKYSTTFVSNIDGSLQYYAVTPQTGGNKDNAALFLSVHGAGVEAIGQAKAYQSKDWGTLVAATNRRPRGFNWEDWGRLDALEVLNLGKERFHPDPDHIYLTGHSMGGHGTWFLGATYPGNWAGIAPCSGYPTLKDYGSADGKIPDSSKNPAEQMLLRAGNQSDVVKLATNYKPLGVYILHGDSDRVVSVKYARQMKNVLAGFHSDYSYYEYPGGEHWFGDQSVDWKPLFDFFKWHKRLPDSAVNEIDFITSSPGISSAYRWAGIVQQLHPLAYSRIKLQRNSKTKTIKGTTENVKLLSLALRDFASNTSINILLDSTNAIHYTTQGNNDTLYLTRMAGGWVQGNKPAAAEKGAATLRYI